MPRSRPRSGRDTLILTRQLLDALAHPREQPPLRTMNRLLCTAQRDTVVAQLVLLELRHAACLERMDLPTLWLTIIGAQLGSEGLALMHKILGDKAPMAYTSWRTAARTLYKELAWSL